MKWYCLKGGWRDGHAGWLLANYAFRYTQQKWRKLERLEKTLAARAT